MDEKQKQENKTTSENVQAKVEKPKGKPLIVKKSDLDFILDIPLELSVELGKCRMLINDLLKLGQGSIVELDKLSGDPLEIYVNRKLIAKGEVVVVNEKFGIRLIDIITPIERVRKLATKKSD